MNKEYIENIEKYGEGWIISDLLIQFHEKTREAIEYQDIDMAQKYAKAISDLTIAYQSTKYQACEAHE